VCRGWSCGGVKGCFQHRGHRVHGGQLGRQEIVTTIERKGGEAVGRRAKDGMMVAGIVTECQLLFCLLSRSFERVGEFEWEWRKLKDLRDLGGEWWTCYGCENVRKSQKPQVQTTNQGHL
jgi:hypothetical protein